MSSCSKISRVESISGESSLEAWLKLGIILNVSVHRDGSGDDVRKYEVSKVYTVQSDFS
jgi:hypothetical protein